MLVPQRVGRKQNFRNPNDFAYPPQVPPDDPLNRHDRPVVIDRREGANGELVLRRAGTDLEVIANGTFLMDICDGCFERAFAREAVAGLNDVWVLIGGLGVGSLFDEALCAPNINEI